MSNMRKLFNPKREIIKTVLAHVHGVIGMYIYINAAFKPHISLKAPFLNNKILL